MAGFFTSHHPIPSTPSISSLSSIPPSCSIPVHDHILPPGWQCMKDPKNNRYYFLNDFTSNLWDSPRIGQGSCTSSRSSSPSHTTYTSISRYYQPFSARYKANDATVQRIKSMFPEVDEIHINQLLRKYNNRENRVLEVLFSESKSSSQLFQPYQSYQPPPPPIQYDEGLLYKLRQYFPSINPETIKQYLIKFENDEHQVIKSILATLAPYTQQKMESSFGTPRMKLRYIKLLYPEVDETILFDLIYNCDLNAQHTMERLDEMGYKRKDIQQILAERKTVSITKSARPKSLTIKPQTHLLIAPPKMSKKIEVFEKLQKDFPKADRILINMALECSQFNEDRARILLDTMTPQDDDKYVNTSWTVSKVECELLKCKGTQTNALIETIFGTPIHKQRKEQISQIRHDMGTWTKEDGIIVDGKKKEPLAKLANPENRKGPSFLNIIKSVIWKGSDSKNCIGPQKGSWKGHNSGYVIGPTVNVKGANSENRLGPRLWLKKKSLAEER